MYRILFASICCLLTGLYACNSVSNNSQATNADTTQNLPVRDEFAEKQAALKQFDALEKLFNNQNYLLVSGNDSTYHYFSRLGKFQIFTHHFSLYRGDSTHLQIDTIQLNNNNQIVWSWQNERWILKNATAFSSEWANASTNTTLQIQQKNSQQLVVTTNNQTSSAMVLKKTIPISLFLIRSHYDYQHHTHLAFDTTNFTKKH